MTYDYRKAVKDDIYQAIHDNFTIEEIRANMEDRSSFQERLYDDLFLDDSVTGNASGSYTFNTYAAEENLLHNWDLIEECAECFGCEPVVSSGYKNGPEYWDVSIRCYLLGECLEAVLDEMEEELEEE